MRKIHAMLQIALVSDETIERGNKRTEKLLRQPQPLLHIRRIESGTRWLAMCPALRGRQIRRRHELPSMQLRIRPTPRRVTLPARQPHAVAERRGRAQRSASAVGGEQRPTAPQAPQPHATSRQKACGQRPRFTSHSTNRGSRHESRPKMRMRASIFGVMRQPPQRVDRRRAARSPQGSCAGHRRTGVSA